MKIKFLGAGSAFSLGHQDFQSNVLIEQESQELGTQRLLYDCGTTIADALFKQDLKPNDITDIFISHLHADHSGGIEYIAFKTYFSSFPFGVNRPKLIGHNDVLSNGWDKTWRGGLESLQGQTNTLENYFQTNYLKDNDEFNFCGTTIRPFNTIHVVDDRRFVPSYGIMFFNNGLNVMISGDTQFSPSQMLTYFNKSDIIFHDCEFSDYEGSVHAQFRQLKTLSKETRAKMWLYHYSQETYTVEELEKMTLEAGFAGLVKRGQEFDLKKLGKQVRINL